MIDIEIEIDLFLEFPIFLYKSNLVPKQKIYII